MLIPAPEDDLMLFMKKLGAFFIGANILFSLPVSASFDCRSDKKITALVKKSRTSVPEFLAEVTDLDDDVHVKFSVKKNYISKGQIRTQILTDEKTTVDQYNTYLTVQGDAWALAIAPEKKRASLYNMNPDVNEVPMFCLSPQ